MRKVKVGLSFVLLVLLCVLLKKFSLLINYVLALIFHELAHLFVAVKKGYGLKEFKITMFGVSIELNENIDANDNFSINIAGPMFNLLLSLVCVAFYWLIPNSYNYLNTFCVSNVVLALFNLLPVYPLDGGKIFSSIIKNNKNYAKFNKIMRFFLIFLCFCMFFLTFSSKINFFFILLAVFFVLPSKQKSSVSLFKYSKIKKIEKVTLLKVSEKANLFELLKKINNHTYTIFYVNGNSPLYLDEDKIISLSTKFNLLTQLKDVLKIN